MKVWLASFEKYHVRILLVFAILCSIPGLIHIDHVIRGWDGADLGSITRNYYRNGFRFAWPQVDWGGNGPGYVEMQFPLVPYLTALMYLVFGVHEKLALVIPFLSGLGTVLAIYYFGKKVFDSTVGFVAGAFLAGSTYWVWLTTVYINDPSMLLCGSVGLAAFVGWIETDHIRYYIFSACNVAMAVLLKLPALYLGFPLLFLWWLKLGKGMFRNRLFWLYGVITLVPAIAWYYHAHLVYLQFGNTFGILSGGLSKFPTADLLLHEQFYDQLVGRLFRYGLTPVVFVLFVIGLFVWKKEKLQNIGRVWSISVIFLLFVAGAGTYYGVQYLLPLLPPAALLAGETVFVVTEKIGKSRLVEIIPGWNRTVLIVGAAISLFAADVVWSMRILPYLDLGEKPLQLAGKLVADSTDRGSLIIVCTIHHLETEVDDPTKLDTPSQIFYYSDHKGWYRPLRWLTAGYIEQCRMLGATCIVFPVTDGEVLKEHPAYNYLVSHYRIRLSRPECLIFDLRVRA